MSTDTFCPQLAQAIHQLNGQIAAFRRAHPHGGTPPELQDLLDELADAENGFRTKCGPPPQLSYLPKSIDFGIVMPGTTGPSLAVDPSIPPPAVSFQGGIEIDSTPADAKVSALIDGDTAHFQVRDILVIDTIVDDVGNVSREVVTHADGGAPVHVKERQLLLVRVQYSVLDSDGTFKATCVIKSTAWETIEVPVLLTLGGIQTRFPSPLVVTQGQDSEVGVVVHSFGGSEAHVTYGISPSQLHTGLAIVGQPITVAPHEERGAKVVFRVDPEAPLGTQEVAIDQFAPQHTSQLVQVTVVQADVLVSLSQAAILLVRSGQTGTISVDITAQGASVNVLLESVNAPNGFRLSPASRNVPAQSPRTVLSPLAAIAGVPRARAPKCQEFSVPQFWSPRYLTARPCRSIIAPVKPERLKSSKRIDGMVALIMAMSRAMTNDRLNSIYEYTGLRPEQVLGKSGLWCSHR